MQDKYEYYSRHLLQTSQKVRKSRMSPGAGAGFQIFAGARAGVEPGQKFGRLRNLAILYSNTGQNLNNFILKSSKGV